MAEKCGLLYIRRSMPGEGLGPEAQFDWGVTRARELNVPLYADRAEFFKTLESGGGQAGNVYVELGVSGSELSRPVFDRLYSRALNDAGVTHVFIHMRDRLARPERAIDAMAIEIKLLECGRTLVFNDRVLAPRNRAQNCMVEDLQMFLDYGQSGKFLNDLAERMVSSQMTLARGGYWTGGRAPYGFARVLVGPQDNVVRELQDHEVVRQAGHHVRIRPQDQEKLRHWLEMLKLANDGWGGKRIANELNARGIPSPDAGRCRKDNCGIRRRVAGKWAHGTVLSLLRNKAIIGVLEWGVRSEGMRRRLGTGKSRLLEPSDFSPSGRPKVIKNSEQQVISSPAAFAAQAPPQLFTAVQERLQARGRSQRGISRSPDPNRYLLAGRVFDTSPGCGSPMYGRMRAGEPTYVCGLYVRTSGDACQHNWAPGDPLVKLLLAAIRSRVFRDGNLPRLRSKLEAIANRTMKDDSSIHRSNVLAAEIRRLELELDVISRNLARAADAQQYAAISREFGVISARLDMARKEMSQVRERQPGGTPNIDAEITQAMHVLTDLDRLVCEGKGPELRRLVEALDARVWLSFEKKPSGRRMLNKVASGVLTTGNAPWPIRPYHLPGDGPSAELQAGVKENRPAGPENPAGRDSLHKVHRGDWIRTSDLLTPSQTDVPSWR